MLFDLSGISFDWLACNLMIFFMIMPLDAIINDGFGISKQKELLPQKWRPRQIMTYRLFQQYMVLFKPMDPDEDERNKLTDELENAMGAAETELKTTRNIRKEANEKYEKTKQEIADKAEAYKAEGVTDDVAAERAQQVVLAGKSQVIRKI